MKHMPAVKSVMTPFPYSIDVAEPIDRARRLMRQHAIRHLPVTERRELAGVVSERQLIGAAPGGDGRPPTVGDVCSREPYVVDLAEPLSNVLFRMAEEHLESALVTRRGKLVGIFTASDACRAFADFLVAELGPGGGTDAA